MSHEIGLSLEITGIEPATFYMLNRRSTTELNPLFGYHIKKWRRPNVVGLSETSGLRHSIRPLPKKI
jgi:hypothetical protein